MQKRGAWALVFFLFLSFALPAHAFCGFYVATGDGPLFNDASRVVLVREGLRTVMSIQNDYQGPLEGFALVVPVPVVLDRANVRTLPGGVLDRVDRLSAPRLVEYWEEDPCGQTADDDEKEGGTGTRAKGEEGSMGKTPTRPLVKVEAEFSVDEYDIVVLSALDSGALDAWLRSNGYVIPAGAEPYLRPYVEEGSKFFVAKVDPHRVRFRWGRAVLSPLRFFYDAATFTLPTRLGLINSAGTQDLIVYVLGGERYETANYENLTIPTNLLVKDQARSQFNTFYAALYDRTVIGHPHAVVTEYAWSPQGCDPCPEGAGPLAAEDMQMLGADVLKTAPARWVLTRLHARYGKSSAGEDLVFKVSPPIVGGRGTPDSAGLLAKGPEPADTNAFQARYIIQHRWEGPVACSNPYYGVWGAPPFGAHPPPAPPANPHARRDLDASSLIVDPAPPPARVPASGLARLRGDIERALESSSTRAQVGSFSIIAALVLIPLVGWRARRGYFATGGIYALVMILALSSTLVTARSNIGHALDDLLPLAAVLVSAAVIATFRVPPAVRADGRRFLLVVAALLPVASGLVVGWRGARYAADLIASEALDFNLSARVNAESLSETLMPIVVGCLRTAVLLFAVCRFARPPREGQPKPLVNAFAMALGTFSVAVLARLLLRGHLAPIDGAVLAAFAFALYVVHDAFARRGGRRSGLVVVTAFLAFAFASLAAFQHGIAVALSQLAGESIDPQSRVFVARFAVQEQQLRLILLLIDTFSLVTFTTMRARTATTRMNGWNVAAAFALVIALVAVVLAPLWTGRLGAIRALDGELARLALPPARALPQTNAPNPELDGPALVVDRRKALFATPDVHSPPVAFAPYLLGDLARAAADSPFAPLLVAPAELSLRSLIQTLAPMLGSRQADYRLLSTVAGDALSGPWAPLVIASAVKPHAVEIEPVFMLSDEASALARRCTGFAFDGISLQLVPLQRDGDAYVVGGFDLDGMLVPHGGALSSIASEVLRAEAGGLAVLLVDPEVDFERLDLGVGAVADLVNPSAPGKPPLFSRIVVSPGLRTLRNVPKER